MFQVTILGSCAALPIGGKNPTSQVLRYNNDVILLDCAEATQIQIMKYKVRGQISVICITHLHGDHCLGLVPLLCSMGLNGRTEPLTIIGPKSIEAFVKHQLDLTHAHSGQYEVDFVELEGTEVQQVFKNENLTITAFPLKHRVTCYGYKIQEKVRQPKFLVEKAFELNIEPNKFKQLKNGEKVQNTLGEWILPEWVLGDTPPSRSYAFCTDTMFLPSLIPQIKNATLVYHEATFSASDGLKAVISAHSTTTQAATIAREATVGKLLIGHFSARYSEPEPLVAEARTIFPETYYAEEGQTFVLE